MLILQNISWRNVGGILINNSHPDIFTTTLLPERFHQHCQAILAVSINGLTKIRSYGLNNHGYADDTQLCLSFKKTSDNAIVIS